MAGVDERVMQYMIGARYGFKCAEIANADRRDMLRDDVWNDDRERGFVFARHAYDDAEKAERERLEREGECEGCLGSGKQRQHFKKVDCEVCHGTGRRP